MFSRQERERVGHFPDVLVQLVRGRKVLAARLNRDPRRQRHRHHRKRFRLEGLPAAPVLNRCIGHAQLIDRATKRRVQLRHARIGLASLLIIVVRRLVERCRRGADVRQRVHVVVSERQLLPPRQIEVRSAKVFVAIGAARKIGFRVRANVVPIGVLQDAEVLINQRLATRECDTRRAADRNAHGPEPSRRLVRPEEERAIAHQSTTERGTALLLAELGDRPIVETLAHPLLVAAKTKCRPVKRVGATLGNGINFCNSTDYKSSAATCSSSTRGVTMGGTNQTFPPPSNFGAVSYGLEYITIASTGNATGFGDLTYSAQAGGTSTYTRGVFPRTSSSVNNMDYVTIATTGNGQGFGDLTIARQNGMACVSNGHGGL